MRHRGVSPAGHQDLAPLSRYGNEQAASRQSIVIQSIVIKNSYQEEATGRAGDGWVHVRLRLAARSTGRASARCARPGPSRGKPKRRRTQRRPGTVRGSRLARMHLPAKQQATPDTALRMRNRPELVRAGRC